jgi:hypothetical protein
MQVAPGAISLIPLNAAGDMAAALRTWSGVFGLGAITSDSTCPTIQSRFSPDGILVSDEPTSCANFFAIKVNETSVRAAFGARADQALFALFPLSVEDAIHDALMEAARARGVSGQVRILRAAYRLNPARAFRPEVRPANVMLVAIDDREGKSTEPEPASPL